MIRISDIFLSMYFVTVYYFAGESLNAANLNLWISLRITKLAFGLTKEN